MDDDQRHGTSEGTKIDKKQGNLLWQDAQKVGQPAATDPGQPSSKCIPRGPGPGSKTSKR